MLPGSYCVHIDKFIDDSEPQAYTFLEYPAVNEILVTWGVGSWAKEWREEKEICQRLYPQS